MCKSLSALVGCFFTTGATLLASDIALAQLPQIPIAQKLKLPPDTAPQSWDMFPEEEVNFGPPVATDGKTAIVSVGRGRAAYAYIKKPNGKWVYEDDLPAPEERVGPGAAVLGDVALVQGKAFNQYVVFVFTRTAGEWTYTQTLPGGYEMGGHNFLALGTDYAAIGVPYTVGPEGFDVDHSTVEIYNAVGAGTYVHDATLFPANAQDPSWQMGYEPKVSGNTVLSPAPANGELDVFVRNGGVWSQEATLPFAPLDPVYAYDGNRAVVPVASQEFVRQNGTWSPGQTIAHPYDPQAQFDNFAAMDGKRLLLADRAGERVFLFERQGGTFSAIAELAPSPKSCPYIPQYRYQRLTLTIKGRTVFRSCATAHSENPDFEGSVLVYELPPLQGSTEE